MSATGDGHDRLFNDTETTRRQRRPASYPMPAAENTLRAYRASPEHITVKYGGHRDLRPAELSYKEAKLFAHMVSEAGGGIARLRENGGSVTVNHPHAMFRSGTREYLSRPPANCRAARRAWDRFAAEAPLKAMSLVYAIGCASARTVTWIRSKTTVSDRYCGSVRRGERPMEMKETAIAAEKWIEKPRKAKRIATRAAAPLGQVVVECPMCSERQCSEACRRQAYQGHGPRCVWLALMRPVG